jgi:antitoxin FitA
MAAITIRGIDEELKHKLRLQAARHGHSMEAEARAILRSGLAQADSADGMGTRIRQLFADVDGADLPVPERTELPRAAEFDE